MELGENDKYSLKILTKYVIVLLLLFIVSIFLAMTNSYVPGKEVISRVRVVRFQVALQMFCGKYGILPEGNNQQLTKVLMGADTKQNPQKIILLEAREPDKFLFWNRYSPALDSKGNYLDGWGTPLDIKVDNKTGNILVRSFGPNRKNDDGKEDDIEASKNIYGIGDQQE